MRLTESDKSEFRRLFPQMRLVPSGNESRVYEGIFEFDGESLRWGRLVDSYQLRIVVDPNPNALPEVWETGGRVARIDSAHINLAADGTRTGSLCLGSYLRLRMETGCPMTLTGFARACIVPYLYAISLREQGKPAFVFGALEHGEDGLVQDYEQILGVRGKQRVINALQLAAKRRRVANKAHCPCDCGQRLGRCRLHDQINALRQTAPRNFFSSLTNGRQLISPIVGR